MGIIEKLELHQFMCHKYLEFNFGPQINFIIGEPLFSFFRAEKLTNFDRSQRK